MPHAARAASLAALRCRGRCGSCVAAAQRKTARRRPRRRQAAVRREVRLLPRAQPRRHEGHAARTSTQAFQQSLQGRASGATRVRGRRRQADPVPEPLPTPAASRCRPSSSRARTPTTSPPTSPRSPPSPGKDTRPARHAPSRPRAGDAAGAKNGVLTIPADPSGQLAYRTRSPRRRPGRSRSRCPTSPGDRAQHRDRGHGVNRRPDRQERRHLAASRRRSRRASTRTSARSPATARPACRAR